MPTPTNVAEDLAELHAIAEEHDLPIQLVLWLAITRTIKSNSARASVSRFFYECNRVDLSTPEFAQFTAGLQAICKALGVEMVRDGKTWYVLRPTADHGHEVAPPTGPGRRQGRAKPASAQRNP